MSLINNTENILEFEFEKDCPLVEYCKRELSKIKLEINHNANKVFVVIYDDVTIKMIEYIKTLMNSHNFKTQKDLDHSNTSIELHFSKSEEKYVKQIFGIHQDDYGGIKCKVNTFIIYFDVDCNGGDLIFYNDSEGLDIKHIVNPNSDNPTHVKGVLFKGDVYHAGQYYTKGHRYLMSFQFERED